MFCGIILWSHLALDLCRVCFYYVMNFIYWSLCSVDLFLLDSILVGRNSLESCPLLLGCQICWHRILHSILSFIFIYLFFLYFCSIHWDFSFFILIWVLSLLFLVSLSRGLSILLFLSKTQLLVLLCFEYFIDFLSNLYDFLLLTLGFVCSPFANSFWW